MMSKVYPQVLLVLGLFSLQTINTRLINPAIGILSESNIYIAQARELNYTDDSLYRIYHHTNPVYHLQSLTANNVLHRLYLCSPTTIYSLDTRIGAAPVPLLPVDDTPCQSSLTFIPDGSGLLWAHRRSILQVDLIDRSREFLWNSTALILDLIYSDTVETDQATFYISVNFGNEQSAVLRCLADIRRRLYPFENCIYIDNGFSYAIALAIRENILYVADSIEQRIYALTVLPSGLLSRRDRLPLNTSTVADVRSMFVYENSLYWLTSSGHVRSFSLLNNQVRTLFWLDEPLRSIRLVSFAQWPNQTTTSSSSTATTTTETTSSLSPTSSTSTTTATTSHSTDTTSKEAEASTIAGASNPWKATAYVTSIILGLALFLCAAMITCVLLNYRLGRVVPNSFTNIFHILRNRTSQSGSLTLSLDPNWNFCSLVVRFSIV